MGEERREVVICFEEEDSRRGKRACVSEDLRFGAKEEEIGSERERMGLTVPERPTSVIPRLMGRTANRGRGKLTTREVEMARVTESV